MNPRTRCISMIATTLLALAGMTSPARADDERSAWREDSREIRQDRRELRGDYRELAADVADYRREKAEGDVAGMRRERMEIRQDKREIRGDQAELRHDQREARHEYRQERTQGMPAQAVNWQARSQAQASPAASNAQRNNGRHIGWQQGRGNPHRS